MFGLTLEEKINKVAETGTDEEVVELISPLLKERISAGVGFTHTEEGLIMGYRAYLVVGELVIPAGFVELDWPYQPMPMPEDFKKSVN